MNIGECEELYPFAQSYNNKSMLMSPHPVVMSSTFQRTACRLLSHVQSGVEGMAWIVSSKEQLHGLRNWPGPTVAPLNDGAFEVVQLWQQMDKWTAVQAIPQTLCTLVSSSLNHSFSRNSHRNSMGRQTAFHLSRLTLTDSSELICSTSSEWRCFSSPSARALMF